MSTHIHYQHTQTSPLSLLLVGVAVVMGIAAWTARDAGPVPLIVGGAALVVLLLAACFHSLTTTVSEAGLQLRYGPIPLFRKHIAPSEIQSLTASRSSLIDGWGIHYIPWRGWTYNLWGFDCVLIERGERPAIRVGTDDPDGLAMALRDQLQNAQTASGS
ncbi:MAG: hypothetical protein KDA75_06235 [Planctomycetaceae bacterium]|nr:hypothetical protein [Planctomycetaceae bacterium]